MTKIYTVLLVRGDGPDTILHSFLSRKKANDYCEKKNSDYINYDPDGRIYAYVSGPHSLE